MAVSKNKDDTGKFKTGNKVGNRFTKSNQPKNPGRKKSRFKQIIAQLEDVGEPLSKEDYSKIIASLLTMTVAELKALAEKKGTPIAIIVIASAIAGDIENKQMNNIERLLDRIFGKALITQELTGKDGKDLIPARVLTKKEAKEFLNKLEGEY